MKLFNTRRMLVAGALAVALMASLPAVSADAAGEAGVKVCGGVEDVTSRVYGSGVLKANIFGYYFPSITSSYNTYHYSLPGWGSGGGYWETSASNYYSYSNSYGYCA